MSETETPRRTRTITLSDRPPVRIAEDEWPTIAKAEGDSWTSLDYSRYQQALNQGELDEWWMRVRQHADGRAIVYGRYSTGWNPQGEEWAGGALLAAGEDIASAIRRVGEDHVPDRCIRECIADLPAEQI